MWIVIQNHQNIKLRGKERNNHSLLFCWNYNLISFSHGYGELIPLSQMQKQLHCQSILLIHDLCFTYFQKKINPKWLLQVIYT